MTTIPDPGVTTPPEDHEPCPDCGNNPADDSLHVATCRRIFPVGHPLEALQFGPPWLPWPRECDHCISPDDVEPFPELGDGVHLCADCRLEALDKLLASNDGSIR